MSVLDSWRHDRSRPITTRWRHVVWGSEQCLQKRHLKLDLKIDPRVNNCKPGWTPLLNILRPKTGVNSKINKLIKLTTICRFCIKKVVYYLHTYPTLIFEGNFTNQKTLFLHQANKKRVWQNTFVSFRFWFFWKCHKFYLVIVILFCFLTY